MRKPILVLQYPDPKEGRTVAMAATRNPIALQSFKEAVLEEAKLAVMDWECDSVLNLSTLAFLVLIIGNNLYRLSNVII